LSRDATRQISNPISAENNTVIQKCILKLAVWKNHVVAMLSYGASDHHEPERTGHLGCHTGEVIEGAIGLRGRVRNRPAKPVAVKMPTINAPMSQLGRS
jgi:hypothetical protein